MTDTVDQAAVVPSDIISTGGISAMTRAEIDIQISTAHRFPRSVTKARADAMAMACADQSTAAGTFYRLKRRNSEGGDTSIEGPSVRMAEIWASCWGNFRCGARVIDIGERFVVAQGVAHDLQSNNCASVEVQRRITNKRGQRYSDDMIGVTANAACSIALRNAILRVIPRVFVEQVLAKAREVAIGATKSLADVRTQVLGRAQKMGISAAQVFLYCEKAGADDLSIEDLHDVNGALNAIRDGEATVDEQFPPITTNADKSETTNGGDKATKLAEAIKLKPAEPPAAPESAPAIDITGQAPPAAPVVDESHLTDWRRFVECVNEAAQAAGITPSAATGGLNRALLLVGKKNDGAKTSVEWRRSVLGAVRAGAFDWATGKSTTEPKGV
jgi:hypothetical protein